MAKVARVIDGDTLVLIGSVADRLVSVHLRLAGINAPELHGRGEVEAQCARSLRASLEALVQGKILVAALKGIDKYGRCLGDLFLPGDTTTSLAALLLRAKVVKAYDGRRSRPPFSLEELAAIERNAAANLLTWS
jgi:endonuclease YncB( thermonuclease family)